MLIDNGHDRPTMRQPPAIAQHNRTCGLASLGKASIFLYMSRHRAAVAEANASSRRGAASLWAGFLRTWRPFWALMLFVHAPAWALSFLAWTASRDPFALLRWGLLTGSLLLFVLKLVDVRWLRLPRDPRVRLTAIVILLLAHTGVFQRALATDFDWDTPYYATLVTGGAGALSLLAPIVRRILDALRQRFVQRRKRAALHVVLASAVPAFLTPRYLRLAHACPVTRAPPR